MGGRVVVCVSASVLPSHSSIEERARARESARARERERERERKRKRLS